MRVGGLLFLVDLCEQPMSKQLLFAAMLSLLVCAPSYANATLDDTSEVKAGMASTTRR